MKFRESQQLESAIDSVFEDANAAVLSAATIARLAQLVTVWASGYLEATCREVIIDYTRGRADPTIVNYVSRTLQRFHNPNWENLYGLMRNLDEIAAEKLMRFADGQIKASVNSIVTNRHRIAHGRSTQMSMAQVKGYFGDARQLAQKMRQLFLS